MLSKYAQLILECYIFCHENKTLSVFVYHYHLTTSLNNQWIIGFSKDWGGLSAAQGTRLKTVVCFLTVGTPPLKKSVGTPLTRWPSASTAGQRGGTLSSPPPPPPTPSLFCNLCIKELCLYPNIISLILYITLRCGVAQLAARRLAVRQARVRFPARHHREVFPTEHTSDEDMERGFSEWRRMNVLWLNECMYVIKIKSK